MKRPATVDGYISNCPKEVQPQLKQLRTAIKQAAPLALEKISYGMPYYAYKGRLTYFRLSKNNIGLYIPPKVFELHKKEIGSYYATPATMHLPLDRPLPVALIKKLVKARMKINDSKK